MRRPTTLVPIVAIAAVAVAGLIVNARAAQTPPAAPPTFNRHVAPILFASCVSCHRSGGIAPFSLMTFAEAQGAADGIKRMVSARAMPPWYADPKFGQFKNSRALSQQQIDTITAWVDAGAPEGTGTAPAPPKFQATGWSMNRPPDQILELPFGELQLPAQGEMPTFTAWIGPLREDRMVQAIEIKPSVPGALHHSSLSLGSMPPGTRIGRAEPFLNGPALDGMAVFADGRPYRPLDGEHIAEKPVMFYVPGGGLLQFPDGFAKRFRRNDYLAWGLHLISRGKPEPVRVQIGLWYARRYPHHEVRTWTVNQSIVANGGEVPMANGVRQFPIIPAGAANWPMTGSMKIPTDITIHALWPHMHYRGKDMTFVLTLPNGGQETLLSVPNYNPHWQITYELAKPLRVRRGSTITAYGHFDNSAANPHNPNPGVGVIFGQRGIDEMFLPFLEVSVDGEDISLERFALPQ